MPMARRGGGWFVDEAQNTNYLLKYYKYIEEFYILL